MTFELDSLIDCLHDSCCVVILRCSPSTPDYRAVLIRVFGSFRVDTFLKVFVLKVLFDCTFYIICYYISISHRTASSS